MLAASEIIVKIYNVDMGKLVSELVGHDHCVGMGKYVARERLILSAVGR